MQKSTIAMLGAGSFGTALAIHIANCGHDVLLWARDKNHVLNLEKDNCNARYLPDCMFPENIKTVADLDEALHYATEVIIATPSHAFASILGKIKKPKNGISWITKGIDAVSNRLLSDLVIDKWGDSYPFAVISGPSFAKEVASGLPTALVVAGNSKQYAHNLISILHNNNIRCYLSKDVVGVQICGAIKNILAIACGISDGLNYGANAKAALITRGLSEMMRLGSALGAKQETFMGLAGIGDLVLTCTDDKSRNRRFGLQIGQGNSANEAIKNIGQVVEGINNVQQVCAIAQDKNIDMPICFEVNAILNHNKSPKDAVLCLMQRPQKDEF